MHQNTSRDRSGNPPGRSGCAFVDGGRGSIGNCSRKRGVPYCEGTSTEESEGRSGCVHPRVDGKYSQSSESTGDRRPWRIRGTLPELQTLGEWVVGGEWWLEARNRGTPVPLFFV